MLISIGGKHRYLSLTSYLGLSSDIRKYYVYFKCIRYQKCDFNIVQYKILKNVDAPIAVLTNRSIYQVVSSENLHIQ